MKKSPVFAVVASLACCLLLGCTTSSVTAEQEQAPMDYRGKVNAPEFPPGIDWLNTDRPLSLRELKGKIVLLDFWTYCCINCMHVIPDLKKLEQKYAKELVVIGVHSAKFRTERETENIRQAILRYEIEHPVVNDWQMEVWQQYGARAWPTLVLVDPEGKVVGRMSGEGIYEPFDDAISKVIATFDREGKIDRRPLDLKIERHRAPTSLLAFPGKVLADETTKQLFISDSNHNRIVVVSLDDSSIKQIIGNGEIGMTDGDFGQSSFDHPQGMAFAGKRLYVADTENHAIRVVDFDKGTVTRLAGTGVQAHSFNAGGEGLATHLNSPWDLVLHGGDLYIAMAGPHQLWKLDLKTNQVRPYAGSGREARIDGPLAESALAQPSGLTTDGRKLYFADSEVSSIRSADLDPNGRVDTIVGGDLFDFGDRDARGLDVRLQHPLGVVYHDGGLYVADTYNNKIKRISLKDRSSQTFLGTGESGLKDGDKAKFDEPGGVSIANGKLYIADTNNHSVRVADLKSKRVETLQIKGLEKLRPRSRAFTGETIEAGVQEVEPGEAELTISIELPVGYKLNAQAPSFVKLTSIEKRGVTFAGGAEQTLSNPSFPVTIPVKVGEGDDGVTADFVLYYCEAEKETLCYFKETRIRIPIKGRKGAGKTRLAAAYKLKMS